MTKRTRRTHSPGFNRLRKFVCSDRSWSDSLLMVAAGATMRGSDRQTSSMFSYVSPEALVPADHPLRPIRVLVNRALERLSGEFDKLYAAGGRDSIAPEKLLRALLLQAFYSVRSERRLMEQVTYNMLFRWFVGLAGC